MAHAGLTKAKKSRAPGAAIGSSMRAAAKTTGTKARRAPLRLYWCETEDHGEDWFIVARSAASACRAHEDEEGYDRGDADAELICQLPVALQKTTAAGWPSRSVLEACGGEVLKGTGDDGEPRVVRIKGRVFGEGDVFELAKARLGQLPEH